MNPIVKKNRMAVDCQGGDFGQSFFAQNTTLIIISHVIKIITKGFMHNNRRLLTCQNGLGQMPQSHFAPLGEMSSLRFQ